MKTNPLLIISLALALQASANVIFTDDFNDNSNTGWTFLTRNGATEIADPVWLEVNGQLEQQTTNYDFPVGSNGAPTLGTIALAPIQIGGHYRVTTTLTSLEPTSSSFQDQVIVFSYQDSDNFSFVETIPNALVCFNVINGSRFRVATLGGITFSYESIVVEVEHNAESGEITVTYGDTEPWSFQDAVFIVDGENSVGVGSNNDAFAIDDFTVTALNTPEVDLEITRISRDPASGNVTLIWDSVEGQRYRVERSTDLQTWGELDDPVGGAGSTQYVDTNVPGTGQVFYRIAQVGS